MGICCPDPRRAHRSDVPLADIVIEFVKLRVSRFGTRLDARSRRLIGDMDTPAPDGNLYTTKAVDLAEQAALLRRRVTNTDRPTCRLAPVPMFPAHCFAISLDIATQRESVRGITVHAWQLSVTES